jgi:drug/metabolite transporter (DMT)-like permease
MFHTWQVNLVLFYVTVVIFFQFYKLSVKKVENDGAATILLQIIAGISVLALSPFFSFHWPGKLSVFLLLVGACIFYAVNDRLQMTVRKNLEVSTFSIINQFSTVFVIIYGLTLFRDPTSSVKLLGAALIVAANAMIFYKPAKQRIEINKYSLLAMAATLAFATAISIDIDISRQFNLPVYIRLTLLLPALIIGLGGRIKVSDSIAEWKKGNQKFFLITGVAWALSIFFSLRAFRYGQVNTVITLEAVAVILNVLAAYIFLKERDKPYRKIAAAFLIFIGVLLTTH